MLQIPQFECSKLAAYLEIAVEYSLRNCTLLAANGTFSDSRDEWTNNVWLVGGGAFGQLPNMHDERMMPGIHIRYIQIHLYTARENNKRIMSELSFVCPRATRRLNWWLEIVSVMCCAVALLGLCVFLCIEHIGNKSAKTARAVNTSWTEPKRGDFLFRYFLLVSIGDWKIALCI